MPAVAKFCIVSDKILSQVASLGCVFNNFIRKRWRYVVLFPLVFLCEGAYFYPSQRVGLDYSFASSLLRKALPETHTPNTDSQRSVQARARVVLFLCWLGLCCDKYKAFYGLCYTFMWLMQMRISWCSCSIDLASRSDANIRYGSFPSSILLPE